MRYCRHDIPIARQFAHSQNTLETLSLAKGKTSIMRQLTQSSPLTESIEYLQCMNTAACNMFIDKMILQKYWPIHLLISQNLWNEKCVFRLSKQHFHEMTSFLLSLNGPINSGALSVESCKYTTLQLCDRPTSRA